MEFPQLPQKCFWNCIVCESLSPQHSGLFLVQKRHPQRFQRHTTTCAFILGSLFETERDETTVIIYNVQNGSQVAPKYHWAKDKEHHTYQGRIQHVWVCSEWLIAHENPPKKDPHAMVWPGVVMPQRKTMQ